MSIIKTWAGRITGTNVGNIFLKLEGNDDKLSGEARLNELGIGIAIYAITGNFSNNTLCISGVPSNQIEGFKLGNISATVILNERGELVGEWHSAIGPAGSIVLYPQRQLPNKDIDTNLIPTFHSASHNFNSLFLYKKDIKNIATNLQSDFPNAEIVITVVNETEKRCFLRDFESMIFDFEKANNIILFTQETEANGTIKSARLDFGQTVNLATIQGGDESWVLGRLNMLRRELKKHERSFPTKAKKFGLGMNQILILGGLVFLPSLKNLAERSVFIIGILFIVWIVNASSDKWLPNAAIYMDEKPTSFLRKYFPSAMSWIFSIVSTLVAVALGSILSYYGVPLFPSK